MTLYPEYNNGSSLHHSHLHGEHSHPHSNYTHSHLHDRDLLHSQSPPNTSHGHAHTFAHGSKVDERGLFSRREPFNMRRDYNERAFTVGIAGPVGSGKSALCLSLCQLLRDYLSIIVVTNDIFTIEDSEFMWRNEALGKGNNGRIRPFETGSCPHAAVREDCSANLQILRQLTDKYMPVDLAFVESGGDNLSANFSRELADYIIFVVDVAAGDKVPRKGGPGITQSDLLVINKTDLASSVGADIQLMTKQAKIMRSHRNDLSISEMNEISDEQLNDAGSVICGQVKNGVGVVEIAQLILQSMINANVIKNEKMQQILQSIDRGSENKPLEPLNKKQKVETV